MGFVVFEKGGGRIISYYKKESIAKAQVTRHNRSIEGNPVWYKDRERTYLSYRDYEGVLMGLDETQFKMWVFCRG
jgi:hypothetical protein